MYSCHLYRECNGPSGSIEFLCMLCTPKVHCGGHKTTHLVHNVTEPDESNLHSSIICLQDPFNILLPPPSYSKVLGFPLFSVILWYFLWVSRESFFIQPSISIYITYLNIPYFPPKGLLCVFQKEILFSDKWSPKCLYILTATIRYLCAAAINLLFQVLLQCCVKCVIASVNNYVTTPIKIPTCL
jgi:hypothetical protein